MTATTVRRIRATSALTTLKNARALLDLSEKEENIIISHMWPLAKTMPHSKEAVIVNLADKMCATLEVSYLSRLKRIQRWIPDTSAAIAG